MSWEVDPEPGAEERAALLQAVEQELQDEGTSEWWRSGLEDLGGGPAPKHPWRGPRVVEP